MAEITYPQEIPWKHFATSKDMMDTNIEDRKFPVKWKSSMAFFYFMPDLDPAILNGRKIIYLKIVCSITGYQVDNNELGVDVANPKEWDSRVYNNFDELIRDYYPCYGALLHLAVFPYNEKDLKRFPHIIDFEPKKREMFEVATETGEVMSRSLQALKVNTGGTSTSSMETIDVDKGWSFGLEGSMGGKEGLGGKLQLGSQYESGYKAMAQGQNVNLRQIDASQEAKETLSYTTQLQQMYHLLDSYHLGTNRALFAIFPRPHIVDQELSVTNGPRRLEGIQEFFLVVSMPADNNGFCVVGQLETSHLHKQSRTVTTGTTEYDRGEIHQTISDSYKGSVFSNYTKRRYQILVPGGYIVDRLRGTGGFTENVCHGDDVTEDIESHQVFVYDDRIEVEVVYDPWPPPDTAYFTADYTVYYRTPEPVSEPETTTVTDIDLFMTGRYLQACLSFDAKGVEIVYPRWKVSDFVVIEELLPRRVVDVYNEIPKITKKPDIAGDIRQRFNELQLFIRDRSLASVNSPDRYPAGEHTILDTDFALRALSTAPRERRYRASDYTTIIRVDDALIKKMDKKAAKDIMRFSRADLLTSTATMMARQTGLSVMEIINLKKTNLNLPSKVQKPSVRR